jgi:hypothetical protein
MSKVTILRRGGNTDTSTRQQREAPKPDAGALLAALGAKPHKPKPAVQKAETYKGNPMVTVTNDADGHSFKISLRKALVLAAVSDAVVAYAEALIGNNGEA